MIVMHVREGERGTSEEKIISKKKKYLLQGLIKVGFFCIFHIHTEHTTICDAFFVPMYSMHTALRSHCTLCAHASRVKSVEHVSSDAAKTQLSKRGAKNAKLNF